MRKTVTMKPAMNFTMIHINPGAGSSGVCNIIMVPWNIKLIPELTQFHQCQTLIRYFIRMQLIMIIALARLLYCLCLGVSGNVSERVSPENS